MTFIGKLDILNAKILKYETIDHSQHILLMVINEFVNTFLFGGMFFPVNLFISALTNE